LRLPLFPNVPSKCVRTAPSHSILFGGFSFPGYPVALPSFLFLMFTSYNCFSMFPLFSCLQAATSAAFFFLTKLPSSLKSFTKIVRPKYLEITFCLFIGLFLFTFFLRFGFFVVKPPPSLHFASYLQQIHYISGLKHVDSPLRDSWSKSRRFPFSYLLFPTILPPPPSTDLAPPCTFEARGDGVLMFILL